MEEAPGSIPDQAHLRAGTLTESFSVASEILSECLRYGLLFSRESMRQSSDDVFWPIFRYARRPPVNSVVDVRLSGLKLFSVRNFGRRIGDQSEGERR